MLFTTFIVRTPVDLYYYWYCHGNHHWAYHSNRGISKSRPLLVATLLEIVFSCLKHYLGNIVCQPDVYLEDMMAGRNKDDLGV